MLSEDDLKQLIALIGERALIRTLLNVCKRNSNMETPEKEVTSVANQPVNILQEKIPDAQIPKQPSLSAPWHKAFEIPEKSSFSRTVQGATESGVVCSRARREICQTLRTLMLQHTSRPTHEEYTEICSKLIQKYPKLHDGGTSGSGSWKLSLRNGFKNFRRDHGDKENGQQKRAREESSDNRQLKRRKTLDIEDVIDDEEYEEAICEMKTEHAKKRGKNHSRIKQLMETTRGRRKKWITEDSPLTSQILQKFPLLSSTKTLRREFRAVSGLNGRTSSLVPDWCIWIEKIIRFSRLEATSRNGIKKNLEEYDQVESSPHSEDRSNFLVLAILLKLLYPKGLLKKSVFIKTYEVDVDLDEEVGRIEQTAPFIALTGKPGEEGAQYFIACEKAIFCESKSLLDAVIDLLAVYYVCDIQYPSGTNAIMVFLQHTIFDLKDCQPLPTPTSKLINNLEKLQ